MKPTNQVGEFQRWQIPDRLAVVEGEGGLTKLRITTRQSTAEVYLLGAHVTAFQRTGEPPLLFTSTHSRFVSGQPIRGGIPIIFPWFGTRPEAPAHGLARLADWELLDARAPSPDAASIRFGLTLGPEAGRWAGLAAIFEVAVAKDLALQLVVSNTSAQVFPEVETCLHTYFSVADITSASVRGLKGVTYLDKVEGFARKQETNDAITFSGETDRVYLQTSGAVEILDPTWRRRILIEKRGSASTVVWNPWVAKAAQMADFGDDEYKGMVCVESGNVSENRFSLEPGQSAALEVTLRATAM